MSAMDREGDPHGADVRPFLPRPGEPPEAYAARLRALHSDLTLVLEAVERGLAERARPGTEGPAAGRGEGPATLITPVPVEPAPEAPRPVRPAAAPSGPRVVTLPAARAGGDRHRADEQRGAAPATATTAPERPEGGEAREAGGAVRLPEATATATAAPRAAAGPARWALLVALALLAVAVAAALLLA
jgi:hypothetical protein